MGLRRDMFLAKYSLAAEIFGVVGQPCLKSHRCILGFQRSFNDIQIIFLDRDVCNKRLFMCCITTGQVYVFVFYFYSSIYHWQ